MRVLTTGPDPNVPMDGMIHIGAQYEIKDMLGEHESIHINLMDHKYQEKKDFLPDQKFDYIIQMGSPFIWDMMHISHKWKNFKTLIQTHPEAKIIFLAIGSCFNIGVEKVNVGKDVIEVFKNSKIYVRDRIAFNFLKHHDVKCELRPCAAFRSLDKIEINHKAEGSAVVWYNPYKGVSSGWWKRNNKEFENWKNTYVNFVEMNNVKIAYYVSNEEKDVEYLPNLIWIKLNSTKDVINAIQSHNKFLSGRVHFAVPAYAAGRDVKLLQVDSRANTLYDFQN
jgi:hypothetical protein